MAEAAATYSTAAVVGLFFLSASSYSFPVDGDRLFLFFLFDFSRKDLNEKKEEKREVKRPSLSVTFSFQVTFFPFLNKINN